MSKKNSIPSRSSAAPKAHPFFKSKAQNNLVAAQKFPAEAAKAIEKAIVEMDKNELILAEKLIDQALALAPDWIEALNAKAVVGARQHRFDQAEEMWLKITNIDPKHITSYSNLGNLYRTANQFDKAEAALNKALEIDPNHINSILNLGVVNYFKKDRVKALHYYKRVLELEPKWALAYFNIGRLLHEDFDLEGAFEYYRKALECEPTHYGANSNLVLTQNYKVPFDAALASQEAVRFGRIMDQQFPAFTSWRCTPTKNRTIKVGFVSGDLRRHPVGYFLEPAITHMNKEGIELHAYSNYIAEDDLTARIKPHFTSWNMIEPMGDQSLAQKIYEDEIDVLIDLSGHTALNRIAAFAYKPAPVEVTWLGYFSTTGLKSMDYILADDICVPKDEESLYTEKVWRLPHSRLALFKPDELFFSPQPCLDKSKPFIFGCFQEMAKINDEVLGVWVQILNACPNSMLRVQSGRLTQDEDRQKFEARLQRAGIALDRCSLHGTMPRDEYLKAYSEVDVLLDTFPFPGGTTTNEALWMGIPTITYAKKGMLCRQGQQLMTAAGLPEWVCFSLEAYIQKAIYYGNGSDEAHLELANWRAKIPELVAKQPAANPEEFAKNFKEAVLGMWAQYCDSQASS